jgi:hypothetical protein
MRRISTAYLFRKVANEQVAIEAEAGQVMMTRWEAFVRQIHTMALNKDASAAIALSATKAIPRKSSRRRQAYVCR